MMGLASMTIPIQIHLEDVEAQSLEPQELVVSFCTGTTAILCLTSPPAWLCFVWVALRHEKSKGKFRRLKRTFLPSPDTFSPGHQFCLGAAKGKMLFEIPMYPPQQQRAQGFFSGPDHRNHRNAPGFKGLHFRSSKAKFLR